MITVNYPISSAYLSVPNAGLQPAVEVELVYGERTTRAVGILDSGSSFTIFSPEFAELIGIDDVTSGYPGRVNTLGGDIDFYLFDLEMEIRFPGHRHRFAGQVGFFAARRPRNILGRNLVFARYEIGFRETQQLIHIRPEE